MGQTTPGGAPAPWRHAPVAFWLAAGGLVFWVVGVLLPWAEFALRVDSPLGDSFEREVVELFEQAFEPASGYELGSNMGLQPPEGRITLVLALGFGVLFFVHLAGAVSRRAMPIAMATVAAVTLVVLGAELTDLLGETGAQGVTVDVGAGIWVAMLGTLAAAAGAVVYGVTGRQPADEAPPAG